MYESIKYAHHEEWCCCNCCPATFRATNRFDEMIHLFEDGCCEGSKVSNSVYEQVSQKMGEDAARMAGLERTPDPDKTYLVTSCCCMTENPLCPTEAFTLKQDVFEYKKIQVAQPLYTCFTPEQLECFYTTCLCNLCGIAGMCCSCYAPACKTSKVSMKYTDISQINSTTTCMPCCCAFGGGIFEIMNHTTGAMAVSIIPGHLLGICCQSSDMEEFTEELIRRAAGTSEDKAAIAAITNAGAAAPAPPAPEKPAEMSVEAAPADSAPGVKGTTV